jgi:hypothetical protein
MKDEDRYWDQYIAGGVLVLALYQFTKDILKGIITQGTLPWVAFFLAAFSAFLLVLFGRIIQKRFSREGLETEIESFRNETKSDIVRLEKRIDNLRTEIQDRDLRLEISDMRNKTNTEVLSLKTEMTIRLDSIEKLLPLIEKITAM